MKSLSIDVTKLDKTKFKRHKNGGCYCGLVLFENRDGPDKYGNDGFVKQECSKEDRDAGAQMPIIGNWKEIRPKQEQRPAAKPRQQEPEAEGDISF